MPMVQSGIACPWCGRALKAFCNQGKEEEEEEEEKEEEGR